jgi:hypothetical protein
MLHIEPHPQTRRPLPRVSDPNFSERVTMEEKRCRYCSLKFRPSRYHPERGEETVEHIVRMFAGYDLNHIRQIERIFQP